MIKFIKQSSSEIHFVRVEHKSDIDKISSAFDGYTNPSITDELILDTSLINECEESTATAIEVFGKDTWNEMPDGLVFFHA